MTKQHRSNNVLTLVAIAFATLALMATSTNAALIGYWKFDEGTGTTTADSSSNSNTATQAGTAGSWITGKTGGAYQLGGSSSRFELADSSDLKVTGAVTVSAWVNPTAASNYGVIAGIDQTGGSGNDMYTLKTSNTDRVRWDVIGPGTNVSLDSTSTLDGALGDIGDGWVHVVGVYDPSVFAGLYVNGSLDTSTTSVPTAIQSKGTPFQIGHNASDSGSYPLRAAVDDIAVWDEALTADEVTSLNNINNSTELLYDTGDFDLLKQIHDAGSGAVQIGDLLWSYTSGLVAPAGLSGSSPDFTLVMDSGPGTGLLAADVNSAAVPEPSTFALAALGLFGLAFFGWRKRK